MRQRGRDFPYPMPINLLFYWTLWPNKVGHISMVGQADNYTLQLLMAAHTTALSQTTELPQVGFPYPHAYIFIVLLDMVAQQVGILS